MFEGGERGREKNLMRKLLMSEMPANILSPLLYGDTI